MRVGARTRARRRTTASSMSAHASRSAPTASSASATRSAPCPYAFALTTAMIRGGFGGPGKVRPSLRNFWIALKLACSAARSTCATVLRIMKWGRRSFFEDTPCSRGHTIVGVSSKNDLRPHLRARSEVREARLLAEEREAHDAGWPVALLADD